MARRRRKRLVEEFEEVEILAEEERGELEFLESLTPEEYEDWQQRMEWQAEHRRPRD